MIRVIHVGVGGRGRWPVNLIKNRIDFKSVAFVEGIGIASYTQKVLNLKEMFKNVF